jgi:Zn-dependent metalloprotease
MLPLKYVICCAGVAALLFADPSRLIGQAPVVLENGRSFALAAAGDTLPEALSIVDAMLSSGTLDIAAQQEDTMMPGRLHERLAQHYGGLPVFGAEVICQMDGRSVVSVMGRLYQLDLGVTPSISPARAGEAAIASAAQGAEIHGETVLGILPVANGEYRLAYRMNVRTDWTNHDAYVDAINGSVLLNVNRLYTQAAVGEGAGVLGLKKKMSTNQASSTYEAADKLRPAEAYTLDFRGSVSRLNQFLRTGTIFNSDVATDSDNVWTDGPTVDAHAYQGWVYDYYFKRFGRRGMDDANLEVDTIVHPMARSEVNRQPQEIVGTVINNALYCCDGLLLFGDGDSRMFNYLAGALDVVAHEWSHGVTDGSSRLVYRDESGALNEAFSDIMAAAMEFHYQPAGPGSERSDWQIAEDVYLLPPGYLRSLSNPAAGGEPDHYSLRRFIGTPPMTAASTSI